MGNFAGRLTLQKTVYLLWAFGINLGYEHTWYKHGVYSPTLTRAGFELEATIKDLPNQMEFASKDTQTRYGEFLDFMQDKKDNPDLLEICSTIHYLHIAGNNKDEVLDITAHKKDNFHESDCVKMWGQLVQVGLIIDE